MKPRRLSIVLLACALIVVSGSLLWPRASEPEYQGVSLTGWLAKGSNDREAAAAVRHIGTNSIPFLVQWLSYEPAPWRRQWRNAFQKLPHPVDRLGRLSDKVKGLNWQTRNNLALDGFEILAPEAAPAVPELTRIMSQAGSMRLWSQAARALGFIGPDALPSLMLALRAKPIDWRHDTALMGVLLNMQERGIDISRVIPAVLQSAADTNSVISSGAWLTLEQLRLDKTTNYLPVFDASLRHSNEVVRACAATFLADVATNVPPALLDAATNVLRSARPEVLKRIAADRIE